MKYSFQLGAVAFLGRRALDRPDDREYPPEDLAAFERMKARAAGLQRGARDLSAIARDAADHAAAGRRAVLHLARPVLHVAVLRARRRAACVRAPDETIPLYTQGVEWAGVCFSMYSAVCFAFSWMLPAIAARLGRRGTHALCLLRGAAGLLSVAIIHDRYWLLLSMTGVGIAWASTLSMPYAILAGAIPPAKTGVYMGIFNFAIVLPEILASLGFGWIMVHVLDNNRLHAVVAGGVCMVIAAALLARVQEGAVHATGGRVVRCRS